MSRAKKPKSRTYPSAKIGRWDMMPMMIRYTTDGKLFVGLLLDAKRSRVDAKNVGHPKYALIVFHGTVTEHTHDLKRAMSLRAGIDAMLRVVPDGSWMAASQAFLVRRFKKTWAFFNVIFTPGVANVNVIKSKYPPGSGKRALNSHEHGLPQQFSTIDAALDYCELVTLTEIDKLCTCEAERVL